MPNAAPEDKAQSTWLARLAPRAVAARLVGRAIRGKAMPAAVAAIVAAGLAGAPAQAEIKLGSQPKSASYAYKFYVGGILIGKANFDARLGDGDYFTEGFLKTDGVSNWFVAATVAAQARGRIGSKLSPKQLDVSGKTEKVDWKMVIGYDGDAPSNVSSHPPFKKKSYEIDPRKQGGALDPMSALIATLAPTKSGTPCRRTIPIFDGRKRYDIVFGKQTFKGKSKTGHRTFVCEARWKRVGGFKPKMMRKDDVTFTARFEVRDGLTVPVKVWGETEFGDAVAILKKIR